MGKNLSSSTLYRIENKQKTHANRFPGCTVTFEGLKKVIGIEIIYIVTLRV